LIEPAAFGSGLWVNSKKQALQEQRQHQLGVAAFDRQFGDAHDASIATPLVQSTLWSSRLATA
jgi:hypothetical protein